MPKKFKLDIESLKVQSFVTSLNNEAKRKIRGGEIPTDTCFSCPDTYQECNTYTECPTCPGGTCASCETLGPCQTCDSCGPTCSCPQVCS